MMALNIFFGNIKYWEQFLDVSMQAIYSSWVSMFPKKIREGLSYVCKPISVVLGHY